jgi:hypothetical protein
MFLVFGLVTPACADPSEDRLPIFDTDRKGPLIPCDDGSFDREQINATLEEHPELSQALGITDVQTCEDAGDYFVAFAEYIESFPSLEEPRTDELRIAAADGTNQTTPGILEISEQDGDFECTGVLIHDRALITAAHCVEQFAPSGEKNFWKTNYEIKNFGGGQFTGTVRINIHPDYTGTYGDAFDDGDDIALVKLTEGSFGFPSGDRHRLYTGNLSTMGTMKSFGRGVVDNNGGEDTLRFMYYDEDWAGSEHFFMEADDASRVCKGDSGGPIRDVSPSGHAVVAGLNTSSEVDDLDDKCAKAGGKMRAVRIQNKVDWIDDMIGGDAHDDCTEFTDNGWTYERCW